MADQPKRSPARQAYFDRRKAKADAKVRDRDAHAYAKAIVRAAPAMEQLLRDIAEALALRDLGHNGRPDPIVATIRAVLRPIDAARKAGG